MPPQQTEQPKDFTQVETLIRLGRETALRTAACKTWSALTKISEKVGNGSGSLGATPHSLRQFEDATLRLIG